MLPAEKSAALEEWLQYYKLVSRSNQLCVNVISNETK